MRIFQQMFCKRIFRLFCLTPVVSLSFGLTCLSPSLRAEEPGLPPQRLVSVGFFASSGLLNRDEEKHMTGYAYEYLQHVSIYTAWRYQYIGYGKSWDELIGMLKNGEIDLLCCATKTPEREKEFAFSSRPLGESANRVTVKAGSKKYCGQDCSTWSGITVGIITGSLRNEQFRKFAKDNHFTATIRNYTSYAELEKALMSGQIDAIVSSTFRVPKNEWNCAEFDPRPFFFMLRKGEPHFLEKLNHAMTQLYISDPDLTSILRRKYFSKKDQKTLPFCNSERRYIQENQESGKKIRAVLLAKNKPFAYKKNGRAYGICKDLADEIILRSGLNIEIVAAGNRREYERLLADPKTVIVLDEVADLNRAERKGVLLTCPYIALSVSRVRSASHYLHASGIAAIRNSAILPALSLEKNTDITFYETQEDVFHAICEGKQREGYLYTQTAEHLSHAEDSQNILFDMVHNVSVSYSIGIRRSSPDAAQIAGIMDKCIASLSPALLDKIYRIHAPLPNKKMSFVTYLKEHLLWAFSVPIVLLLLFTALLLYLLWSRRESYQKGEVLKRLPLRYTIFDEKGQILRHELGNSDDLPPADKFLRSIDDLPLEQRMLHKALADVIRTGKPFSINFVHNGRGRSATLTKLPRSLFQKEAAVWISQDTEAIQRARASAQEYANHLKLTLNSIGEGVMVCDVSGCVTLLNPVAEAMTGYRQAEAMGLPHEKIFDIRNHIDGKPMDSVIRQTLQKREKVELPDCIELVAHDGTRHLIASSCAPILDAQEKMTGAILVFRDVTQEHVQQDQLHNALEQAQAAAKAKSFFIASVSHEIRTPLNAVIGFTELLHDRDLTPEQEIDYLDSINSAGNALLQLINDVLDLSKLEADQMTFRLEPTDFGVLGRELMKVFTFRAWGQHDELSCNIPDMPLLLDKMRIRQILFNLIGNAVKFTENGRVTLHAEFQAIGENRGRLSFYVSDTGIGISKEDCGKLMEPFVQLSHMRGTNAGNTGTGLGLAISKRLVEKMGGSITIQSKVGFGSTFGITLPDVHCGLLSVLPVPSEVAVANPCRTHKGGLSILLVDDVEMNLKVMAAICRKAGAVELFTANSGEAALKILRENSINLILTDLWMPGMNGAELARTIRQHPAWSKTAIVAVTADIEANDNFPMGLFSQVLFKPVTLDKVEKVLTRFQNEL